MTVLNLVHGGVCAIKREKKKGEGKLVLGNLAQLQIHINGKEKKSKKVQKEKRKQKKTEEGMNLNQIYQPTEAPQAQVVMLCATSQVTRSSARSVKCHKITKNKKPKNHEIV